MSEFEHRKSLGKALRVRGYSSAKSVEIQLTPASSAKLLAVLSSPSAQGEVVSLLVDKDKMTASVLWQKK